MAQSRRVFYRRCSRGHLFTSDTPGELGVVHTPTVGWSRPFRLKSIRFGAAWVMHCPVGNHWGWVKLVKEGDLTDEERRTARLHLRP